MNKKIMLFIILIITICFIIFINICHKSDQYNNLVIDSKMWDEIKENKNDLSNDIVMSILFNGYELLYDIDSKTYYYSLIENDRNRFNPDVSFKASIENSNIVFNKKIEENLIENNEAIEVLVYTNDAYGIFKIKCTTLPIMNIYVQSVDDISADEKTKIQMNLFDNRSDATQRIIKSDGKIHIRGAISQNYSKKGYKIDLTYESLGNHTRKNHISLLGMRKDDDWLLYSVYNDPEKIRNVFAMNLWTESCSTNNKFKIKNGNEYKYIELFINNRYWGLYAICYPIDEKQLNVDNKDEYMFKKLQYNHAEEEVFEQNTLEMEYYKLVNDSEEYEKAWNTLKNYFIDIQSSKDDNYLYSLSDIDNIIDYYLFQLFIQGNDNCHETSLKNIFLTFKNYNGEKVCIYTPWDYDLCLGNIFGNDTETHVIKYDVDPSYNRIFKLNPLGALQKNNNAAINQMIKDRYADLRSYYWSMDHIKELLSKYEKDIFNSGAYSRDSLRWLDGEKGYDDKKLSEFEKYIEKRLYYTDEFVNSL